MWNVTCSGDHEHNDEEEHDHVHGEKSQKEVMLTDLFHIVHYCGILLNKASPADDDCTPFEEFTKYSKTELVDDHHGGLKEEVEYVDVKHIPKILFAIFVGQKDEVRIDAAQLL